MNISTLTTVVLSALFVTSGLAFAAPGGTADVNAGASGNVSAGGADATDSDRDRRPRTTTVPTLTNATALSAVSGSR